ncbi:MAG: hypothetical protein AB7O26_03115, partial [Planctomycetaceae bacterium]
MTICLSCNQRQRQTVGTNTENTAANRFVTDLQKRENEQVRRELTLMMFVIAVLPSPFLFGSGYLVGGTEGMKVGGSLSLLWFLYVTSEFITVAIIGCCCWILSWAYRPIQRWIPKR